MEKNTVEIRNRKAAMARLKDFCTFSMGADRKDKGDFLEVTEWTNGEGYDIRVSDVSGEKQFHITCGQYEAMKKCIKKINKQYKK
jgi:hypothetical protein